MCFPYDFGFIPNTKGEDGDPLDVIIISENGTFTGCSVACRIVGCIRGEQTEKNKTTVRNDRYLAIPDASLMFDKITSYKNLHPQIIEQLQFFFVHYNSLAGKHFELMGLTDAEEAYTVIKSSLNDDVVPTKEKH